MPRVKRGLIGAIASCDECPWREEGYDKAQREARKHHLKTGHIVTVETIYAQTYGEDNNHETK